MRGYLRLSWNPLNETACLELKDDSYVVSRASSVVVKRVPAIRPGKGKAAMYVAGTSVQPLGDKASTPSIGAGWNKGTPSKRVAGPGEGGKTTTGRTYPSVSGGDFREYLFLSAICDTMFRFTPMISTVFPTQTIISASYRGIRVSSLSPLCAPLPPLFPLFGV